MSTTMLHHIPGIQLKDLQKVNCGISTHDCNSSNNDLNGINPCNLPYYYSINRIID